MNRLIVSILLLSLCSGCLFLNELHPPKNFGEDDLIGAWKYQTVDDSVLNKKTGEIHTNAELIIKFHENHTYEELLAEKGSKNVFRSTWTLNKQGVSTSDGYLPVVKAMKGQYLPKSATILYNGEPKFTVQSMFKDGRNPLLCYPTGDPDDWYCYRKI